MLERIYSVIYDMHYSPIGRYQSGEQKLHFDSLKNAAKYVTVRVSDMVHRRLSRRQKKKIIFDRFLTNLN